MIKNFLAEEEDSTNKFTIFGGTGGDKLNRYDSKIFPQNYPIFKIKWNVDKK